MSKITIPKLVVNIFFFTDIYKNLGINIYEYSYTTQDHHSFSKKLSFIKSSRISINEVLEYLHVLRKKMYIHKSGSKKMYVIKCIQKLEKIEAFKVFIRGIYARRNDY